MTEDVDAIYYRDGVNKKFSMNVLKAARQRMYNLFMSAMQPAAATTILDIGVSDEENDGANFLEKQYPWPHNIFCAGLGTGDKVRERYPKIQYRQIESNRPLPFADQSFDIACSNAVLEHVGGPAQRRAFLLEHLRVARSVFVTVPNRWFPVEHHTGLPFLHYSAPLFRRLLRGGGKDYWVHPENMDFLDRSLLLREWPGGQKPEIRMTGLPLGPFSSNIALIFKP